MTIENLNKNVVPTEPLNLKDASELKFLNDLIKKQGEIPNFKVTYIFIFSRMSLKEKLSERLSNLILKVRNQEVLQEIGNKNQPLLQCKNQWY